MRLDLGVEIRLGLEGIGIQLAGIESGIGQDIILEHHQLHVQALCLGDLGGGLGDLLFGTGHDAELDLFRGSRARRQAESQRQYQSPARSSHLITLQRCDLTEELHQPFSAFNR